MFLDKSRLTLLTKARKPGNQQQFNHSVKVLEKTEVTLDALDVGQVEKAKEALKEDTSLSAV